MNMPKIGIRVGLALIALGVIGYFAGGMASITAFIPSFFGMPILLFSWIARNPEKLKLGMHLALVFGFLGFLAPLGRIIPKLAKGEFALNLASISMIVMSLICAFFVWLCIKSFRAARVARTES